MNGTRTYSAQADPVSVVACAWAPYALPMRQAFPLAQLVRRDVASKYVGSLAGFAWSVLSPLLLLAVFTFLFGYLFTPKGMTIPEGTNMATFAKNLFAGLLLHQAIADVLTRCPIAITVNTNYVKKLIFPVEILPLSTVLSATVGVLISVVVLIVVDLLTGGAVHPSYLYLPVVLLPFVVMIAGLGWFLAAFGAFVRDIGHVTGLLVTVLLFLSPIFIRVEALPAAVRPFIYLNPLTVPVLDLRRILFDGAPPDWVAWTIYTVIAFLSAWFGFYVFMRAKRAFADVV